MTTRITPENVDFTHSLIVNPFETVFAVHYSYMIGTDKEPAEVLQAYVLSG